MNIKVAKNHNSMLFPHCHQLCLMENHEEGNYGRVVQVVDNLAYIIDVSGDELEIVQLW
ncbi:hypothetical protein ES705_42438 [subsurface metagenome]